jgi:predicted ferric reductase
MKKRYRWLKIHRLTYSGLILIALHIFYVRGEWYLDEEQMRNIFFLIFFICSLAVGGVGLCHVFIPERIYRSFNLEVVHCEAKGYATEVVLQTKNKINPWSGGDFGFFKFMCKEKCGVSKEFHAFSIAKAVDDKIHLIVAAVGDDSQCIRNMKVGTPAVALGPYGLLRDAVIQAGPKVWIVGGLGIIPLLGVLDAILQRGLKIDPLHLLILRRRDKDWFWHSEIERFKCIFPSLHVYEFFDEAGHVGILELERCIADWKEAEVYLSGPKGMVRYWRGILAANQYPKSKIHTEDFML